MSESQIRSTESFPAPPHSDSDSYDSPTCIAHLHDDIFSSASSTISTPTLAPVNLHNQDLVKLRSIHATEGYRSGISVSKAGFVQEGFDRGYEFGGKMGLVAGWVRGVVEGLVYVVSSEATDTATGTGTTSSRGELELDWAAVAKDVRTLARDVEREVVVEKLLSREWITEDGLWRWDVLNWDGEGEGDGEGGKEVKEEKNDAKQEGGGLDLDLVVQSHPVLRKLIGRAVEMAGKLGLDINRDEEAGVDSENENGERGKDDGNDEGVFRG